VKVKRWLKEFAFARNLQSKFTAKIPFNFYTKKLSGLGNRIQIDAQIIWNSSIRINGSNNRVTIAASKSIRKLRIKIIGNDNTIHIGEDCQIKQGVVWIEGDGNSCRIGRQTTIEAAEFFLTEKFTKIELGDDCMLGDSIVFRTGDSHSILDAQTGRVLNPAGNIIIGDHVWIGQGVTLLKNVAIGSGAVIGTRSLVNKPFVEENLVIAGIPARKIRSGVRWIRERLEKGTPSGPA
jgi:acetyltransferase-like isoleucine patch superfamily enzyme